MAPKLSREDVLKIAELARLELTPDEVERFTRQLGDILTYAEAIGEADTTGIPPTSHPFASVGAWREDAAVPSLSREAALQNAPEAAAAAGLFKVPRVL
jgi:aspartyl-tRNA(Asn)/glutamyl-tRNA(Gln) amidotransferase subunit C